VSAPDTLPSWEGLMMLRLRLLSDGKERTRREVYSDVVDHMQLSDEHAWSP